MKYKGTQIVVAYGFGQDLGNQEFYLAADYEKLEAAVRECAAMGCGPAVRALATLETTGVKSE